MVGRTNVVAGGTSMPDTVEVTIKNTSTYQFEVLYIDSLGDQYQYSLTYDDSFYTNDVAKGSAVVLQMYSWYNLSFLNFDGSAVLGTYISGRDDVVFMAFDMTSLCDNKTGKARLEISAVG